MRQRRTGDRLTQAVTVEVVKLFGGFALRNADLCHCDFWFGFLLFFTFDYGLGDSHGRWGGRLLNLLFTVVDGGHLRRCFILFQFVWRCFNHILN